MLSVAVAVSALMVKGKIISSNRVFTFVVKILHGDINRVTSGVESSSTCGIRRYMYMHNLFTNDSICRD